MKQLIFSILLATLFVACDKNSENLLDLTKIRIKERPCEILEYVGKIGNDFESALDSLRKRKNISSEVTKVPLEVLFDYGNRTFYGIVYDDCGMYTDVLDTKGNYYLRSWYCPDENDTDMQEESIFKENKTFKIIHGACGTIMYQGRIGNDFDSALDLLIKLREPTIFANTWVEEYYTEKEVMTIEFNYDDRTFYSIGLFCPPLFGQRVKDC